MSGLCGVGTQVLAWGQQPPHTSGIPEAVDSHTGTHIQLQWHPLAVALDACGVPPVLELGTGVPCVATQPCSPQPRTAEPVKPHGWEGICACWAGVYGRAPRASTG